MKHLVRWPAAALNQQVQARWTQQPAMAGCVASDMRWACEKRQPVSYDGAPKLSDHKSLGKTEQDKSHPWDENNKLKKAQPAQGAHVISIFSFWLFCIGTSHGCPLH